MKIYLGQVEERRLIPVRYLVPDGVEIFNHKGNAYVVIRPQEPGLITFPFQDASILTMAQAAARGLIEVERLENQ